MRQAHTARRGSPGAPFDIGADGSSTLAPDSGREP